MRCIVKGCVNEAIGKSDRSSNTGMCPAHRRRKRLGRPLNVALRSRFSHGLSKTHPLYKTWRGMRERCNNPRSANYLSYGGRGIRVCERWNDFSLFIEDIGEKPTPNHTLDRKDNDGNYEPDNVRWATRREQVFNQRINRRNKSGTTGVHWDKNRGQWLVNIAVKRKTIHIGRYDSKTEAINARLEAERRYGE